MATYYIFGKDDLLIRERVEECLGRADAARHFAEELKLAGVIELLVSRDLFSLEEYHWVDNVSALSFVKGDSEALENAIKSSPPNKFIAFTQNTNWKDYRKAKDYERSAIHKALDGAASQVHDLTRETYPDRMGAWTRARAARFGLVLGEAGAEYLAEACAYLPQLVEKELEKLSLLKASEKPQAVPDRMLREQVAPVPTERVFSYLDALFERRSLAVHLLRQIIEAGGAGVQVLSLVHGRLELLAACAALGRGGMFKLPEVMRMHKSARDRFAAQLGGWRQEQISRAMELVGETDFRLKSSGADEYDVMAAFTMEVMNL
ncbi:MAG: hypothetical protein HRF49_10165 [bacterium]